MENQQKLCDTCGYKDRRDARSYKARLYVIMQCNRWFGVTPLQQSNFREGIPKLRRKRRPTDAQYIFSR